MLPPARTRIGRVTLRPNSDDAADVPRPELGNCALRPHLQLLRALWHLCCACSSGGGGVPLPSSAAPSLRRFPAPTPAHFKQPHLHRTPVHAVPHLRCISRPGTRPPLSASSRAPPSRDRASRRHHISHGLTATRRIPRRRVSRAARAADYDAHPRPAASSWLLAPRAPRPTAPTSPAHGVAAHTLVLTPVCTLPSPPQFRRMSDCLRPSGVLRLDLQRKKV